MMFLVVGKIYLLSTVCRPKMAYNAELVATFESEEVYALCISALEKDAKSKGMILTESVEEQKEDKIFKIKERIWQLKEERTTVRNKQDFSSCSYLSAQIYGLEQAINILEN